MKRDQTFTARSKVTKDLHFLMDLVPEQITDNITKRVEVEGTGDMIKDIRGEFDIYISYEKYSYDGSFLGNVITSKIRSNESAETLPKAIILSVKSMRLYEKAWINSSQFSDHQTKGLQSSGCHLSLTLTSITFKNTEQFTGKMLYISQLRSQSQTQLSLNNHPNCLKLYRSIILACTNIDRSKIKNIDHLKQLEHLCKIYKQNYLRCILKVWVNSSIAQINKQQALKWAKQLIKIQANEQRMYLCSFMEALNGYFAVALERAKEIIARGDKGGRGTHLVGRIREVMELGDGIWGGRAGRGG